MRAMRKRWVRISLGVLAILIAGVSFYFDGMLRATIERNINRNLKGYCARIRAVRFHPIGFSLDLLDTVIVQDRDTGEHPHARAWLAGGLGVHLSPEVQPVSRGGCGTHLRRPGPITSAS